MRSTSPLTTTGMVLTMLEMFMTMPNLSGAACDARLGHDPEVWFPETFDHESREAVEGIALEVCWTCNVWTQCLQFAIDKDIKDGVWGGMTARDRQTLMEGTTSD